jgi:hypothetical protein
MMRSSVHPISNKTTGILVCGQIRTKFACISFSMGPVCWRKKMFEDVHHYLFFTFVIPNFLSDMPSPPNPPGNLVIIFEVWSKYMRLFSVCFREHFYNNFFYLYFIMVISIISPNWALPNVPESPVSNFPSWYPKQKAGTPRNLVRL